MAIAAQKHGVIISTKRIVSPTHLEREIEKDEQTSGKLRLYTLIIGLLTISGLIILYI